MSKKFSWKYDPENYPDQRINWATLNRSQKSYTIKAYNRARLNNGEAPIKNFWDPQSPHYIADRINVTAPTIGKPAVTPRGFTPEKLEEFFRSKIGAQKIAEYIHEAVTRNPDISGPSGSKKQKTSHTGSSKRPAESQIEQPPGPSNPAPKHTTKSPSTTTQSSTTSTTEMPITGSGQDEDMELGGDSAGKQNARKGPGGAGGFSTATGPNIQVARPRNFANSGGLTFEKVHRVLAYGLSANPVIHPLNNDAGTSVDIVLMTTSLMEIPWDRPFFYLSPGELDSLPKGSYVKSVHIEVTQRNPRVAFETAASTSSLATLNQNKFGIKAVGLNALNGMRVTTRRYTNFEPEEPMIPNSTIDARYDDIDAAMYGYAQNTAQFANAIPSSCFLQPITMPNYLTCWNHLDTEGFTSKNPGWYSLAEHVSQFDMQATAGTTIIKADYTPTFAPLKEQTAFAEYLAGQLGTPSTNPATGAQFNTFTYTDGDSTKQVSEITLANVTAAATASPNETFGVAATDAASFGALNRYSLIEKGQLCKNIDRGDNPKCVQPSVHVGISPVPRLTSTAGTIQPNSWTDVQAYYEIKATMHVGYHFPHHNTHQTEFNIEAHDVKMAVTGQSISSIYPVRFGKHYQFSTVATNEEN